MPNGIITSANWNVTVRPYRTTLAPIFIRRFRSMVGDQRHIANDVLYRDDLSAFEKPPSLSQRPPWALSRQSLAASRPQANFL